jgi:hypothetical protein
VDVAGGEHGLGAAPKIRFIEAAFDAALAFIQLSGYSRVHLKTLVAVVGEGTAYSSDAAEMRGFSSFFKILPIWSLKDTLFQGLGL